MEFFGQQNGYDSGETVCSEVEKHILGVRGVVKGARCGCVGLGGKFPLKRDSTWHYSRVDIKSIIKSTVFEPSIQGGHSSSGRSSVLIQEYAIQYG